MSEIVQIAGFEIVDAKARKDINTLKNKKYLFIADSYGVGSNPDGLTLTTWTKLVPQYLGLTTDDYKVSNVSGSGFVVGTTYLNQLKSFVVDDKNSITDIVVCGGANDRTSTVTEIETAISTFMDYAKENYPNATVRVGHIGWSVNQNNSGVCSAVSLQAYRNVVKYGGVYLNNVEYSNHEYDAFVSDGWHPGQKAQDMISRCIANAILTGSCNVSYAVKNLDTAECVFDGGIVFGSSNLPPIRTTLCNNVALLYSIAFMNVTFTARDIVAFTQYNLLKLGKSRLVSGALSANTSIENTTLTLIKNDNTKIHLPGALMLTTDNDGETYLAFRVYGDTATYTNVKSVNISPFKFNLNSEIC